MPARVWLWFTVLWVSTAAGVATAQPAVIFDSGSTTSIRGYLEGISIRADERRPRPQPELATPTKPLSPIQLPVRTPEMQAGRLIRTLISEQLADRLRRLPRPLFVIGSDRYSQRWLAGNRSRLLQLGAVGMLVDVETRAQLKRLRELGRGLVIVPAPGSELAKVLGITRYPLLITADGILQ